MSAPKRAKPTVGTFNTNDALTGALQSISDHGADFAWDLCRAEALEAGKGLVEFIKGEIAIDRLNNDYTSPRAFVALAAWDKWVQGN